MFFYGKSRFFESTNSKHCHPKSNPGNGFSMNSDYLGAIYSKRPLLTAFLQNSSIMVYASSYLVLILCPCKAKYKIKA
jgi:hypothetical protein